jgi:hypothetical protein
MLSRSAPEDLPANGKEAGRALGGRSEIPDNLVHPIPLAFGSL